MPLDKIIDIQKIGRFEKLGVASGLRLSKVTLIFGENGWGKSTIADILRSLTTKDARILAGRETLAAAGDQKALLLVDGNQASFDGTQWLGPCPKVAVYDQAFINQNVFSGDAVSHEHLKKQYGLVVGEAGVALMQDIVALEAELSTVNTVIKRCERALQSSLSNLGASSNVNEFIALEPLDNADEMIARKEGEVVRAGRSDQIIAAQLPNELTLPTPAQSFEEALLRSIDGVAADAYARLRAHIDQHQDAGNGAMSHEAWLETGMSFTPEDPCPYCGQELQDRSLVEAYRDFFSDAYKTHAQEVVRCRAILKRHTDGEFIRSTNAALQNVLTIAENWKTLANAVLPDLTTHDGAIAGLAEAAREIDTLFEEKQTNLVAAVDTESAARVLRSWQEHLGTLETINHEIVRYRENLVEIQQAQGSVDLSVLREELVGLKARKRRYEEDVVADVEELSTSRSRKQEIETNKKAKRADLTAHTKVVTEGLGNTINAYLDRLGAGFGIDYQPPNYRGNEPSAAFNILINNVAVPPRAAQDDLSQPSFKNTLSAGDKSVLALALFLATLRTRSDLSEMIVVLDDPFTSMDEFRRTFTVNEINKLVPNTAQIIVLSHEKNFLRLIWDTIDQSLITSVSIQTGAPGIASLAHFDLEKATRPRYVSERMEVEDFYQLGQGEPNHIRALLRKVLENFYRQGDPDLFSPNELLGGIIDKLRDAPEAHRFKGALEELEEINRYTRNFHHAPVEGSVQEDTSVEELKTYCRRVINLTRGGA
ncbi:MAG: AAA family ATPase [bacterium]